MVIKKISFCLIAMFLFIISGIFAETIEDSSSSSFNIITEDNNIQLGNNNIRETTINEFSCSDLGNANIKPTTIKKLSCGKEYLKSSLVRGGFGLLFIFGIIEIVLKGFGMWRAARRNQKEWFIAILLLSFTLIVPLIYLIITRDKKKKKESKS